MAAIFDYISWRGDLTFKRDPFNEVDNAVFSMLAYVDYEGLIAPEPGRRTALAEACARYTAQCDPRKEQDMPSPKRVGIDLMRAAARTNRFKDIGISDYRSITDREAAAQMAAVTFWLSDHLAYVAYRGTDGTIVGWKEDFLLGCIPQTRGQAHAVEYLNECFGMTDADMIVGVHSKGGNFAVYASAFCRESVRNRIVHIYSNDGPGFLDEVTAREEFQEIIPRLTHIIPDGSVIGVIMDNQVESVIVKSSAAGLNQHRIDTWLASGPAFVRGEKRPGAQVYQDGIGRLIRDMDPQERILFTDNLFNALQSTGAQTLRDLVALPQLRGLLDSLGSRTLQQGEAVIRAVGNLARSLDRAAGQDGEKKIGGGSQ